MNTSLKYKGIVGGEHKRLRKQEKEKEQKKAASVSSLPTTPTEDEGSSSAEVVLCAICGDPYEDLTEDVDKSKSVIAGSILTVLEML